MAMPQTSEQDALNVKLVHTTKQNSPDDPVQLAFSVVDEQGNEQLITGEIPYAYELFHICQENGWIPQTRRFVSSIREPRRKVTAA